MNALDAVENQRVSICRLSDANRVLIIKALRIASAESSKRGPKFIDLQIQLNQLVHDLSESKELWLIESLSK